jgi:signal peptidase I
MERIKKRRPFAAALLSIISPGLGQIYNVQLKKGVIFYLVSTLSGIMIVATSLATSFYGGVALLIITILIYLYILADAIVIAVKSREARLKRYNRWYYYLLFFMVAAGISLAYSAYMAPKIYSIKAYSISTGGMMPTLLKGDHIITELNPYKKEQTQRGDIIVFKYPEDPERDFIKRIIGIGGDKIQSIDKVIYINGAPIDEPYTIYSDEQIKPGGIEPRDNFGPFVIPDDKLFVLGDNRDGSYDSRYWGYVGTDAVISKAIYIYWSWDDETGPDRLDRIGKIIE